MTSVSASRCWGTWAQTPCRSIVFGRSVSVRPLCTFHYSEVAWVREESIRRCEEVAGPGSNTCSKQRIVIEPWSGWCISYSHMTAFCTLPRSHMISPCGSINCFLVWLTGEPVYNTKISGEALPVTKFITIYYLLLVDKDPIPDESMKWKNRSVAGRVFEMNLVQPLNTLVRQFWVLSKWYTSDVHLLLPLVNTPSLKP